jgi:1-acyl-sn-glycerol-3-phosphate acyltransferase
LRLLGWRVFGEAYQYRKAIIIGIPHTTNWDGFFAILALLVFNIRFRWLGKESLFRPPLGLVMRLFGGVPVNRSQRQNMVETSIKLFASRPSLFLLIAPEGTRGGSAYLRSGFYHIALGAGVPILPGYISYEKRYIGLGEPFYLTGDMEADVTALRIFYQDKLGAVPERVAHIRFRPQDDTPSHAP